MSSGPTWQTWGEFLGVLALESLVVLAAAKLISRRLRSAQWQRAVWQIAIVVMWLAVLGELNGVRAWLRLPSTAAPAHSPAHAVVVTTMEPNMDFAAPAEGTRWDEFEASFGPQTTAPHRRQPVLWPALVLAGGAALLLLRVAAAQLLTLTFRSAARRWPDGELMRTVERFAALLGIRRRITLAHSHKTRGPFTFGVRQPVIVLPQDFADRFAPTQQQVALAHELAHVAHFDSLWRTVTHILCAVLWWNPFAWMAKRELDRASELAADEASLMIANGPEHLAECLVLCAKAPRPPWLAAWLGMDGGRFRSALGQRVARLMELSARGPVVRPIPSWWRLLAPLLCVGGLWLGLAAFDSGPREDAPQWQNSILGSALAAVAPRAETGESGLSTNAEIARLVSEGVRLYQTGKLLESETMFIAARKLDPTNHSATYYLELIRAREAGNRTRESRDDPARTSPERLHLRAKLRAIRLAEWGPIESRPLHEVLKMLAEAVRKADPDGQGINLIFSPGTGADKDERAQASQTVRLQTKLDNLTVENALDVLTTVSNPRIQYSVEDYGVVISPKAAGSPALHTRFFKIPVEKLREKLGPKSADTNAPAISIAQNIIPAFKQMMAKAGVELSASGKAVFWNDRLEMLMVRATAHDLTTIEETLGLLTMSPRQLTLRVKVFEVARDPNRDKHFDWFIGSVVQSNGAASEVTKTLTAAELNRVTAGTRNTATTPAPTFTGILTDEQFRAVVRALETRGGTDLLSAPEVTTLSGRQAQIKVVDVRYIVTDLDYGPNAPAPKTTEGGKKVLEGEGPRPIAEPFELGPIVDIVPYVNPDGRTIQMTVRPTLREFLGYDDPGPFTVEGGPGGKTSPVPLPKFRLRQAATTAVVHDGQTLVIGAGTARHTTRETKADGTTQTRETEKELFFFVTPHLIDAAGNALHSGEELTELHQTVPKQNGAAQP